MFVQYKVRPVTRFVVTRFHSTEEEDGTFSGGSGTLGEFDCFAYAYQAANAMAKEERQELGDMVDDKNFAFPDRFAKAEEQYFTLLPDQTTSA